jgi:acyl-CoA thioesterase-1
MIVDGLSVAEPKIVAATGWSSTDLIPAIQLTDLQVPFDVVTLQIGVNNQFRQSSITDFERDLAELTNIAVDLSGGVVSRVVLVSIPNWSVTPFAEGAPKQQIAGEIDEFDDVIRAQAGTLVAYFVDVTQTSIRAVNEPDLIAVDGLHVSGNIYAEWVGLIQPVVEEISD